ncbi:MAG: response regulator [Planctomycetota bacterium]|jgi:DNA-binding response OmpR family regulator
MFRLHKPKKKSVPAKILVVDDELDFVSTIESRLRLCKYDVVTAANGREGLEKACSERPDLLLLDTRMPVMNGHEMLERMRKDSTLKDVPVIMLTALCEPEDIATASSYGIADYIAKPFDFADLLEKISAVLQGKTLSST